MIKKNLLIMLKIKCLRTSSFVIKDLRKTVLVCSFGAQVESFEHKNRGQKSRDTVPLHKRSGAQRFSAS